MTSSQLLSQFAIAESIRGIRKVDPCEDDYHHDQQQEQTNINSNFQEISNTNITRSRAISSRTQNYDYQNCNINRLLNIRRTSDSSGSTSSSRVEEQQEKRVRRLLSMFRFWRNKTEMYLSSTTRDLELSSSLNIRSESNTNNSNIEESFTNNFLTENQTTYSRANQSATVESNQFDQQNQSQPSRRCPQHDHEVVEAAALTIFVPSSCTESQIHFSPSLADETLRETKRLWQSLVLPLVLGCIIFLLIVWTRQISLVLLNDTIVMVIILGAVFIIISGMAFWLAQDQQFEEEQVDVTTPTTETASNQLNDESNESPLSEVTNHHHHHHHNYSSLNNNHHHCSNYSHLETYCQRHLHQHYYSNHQNRQRNLLSSLTSRRTPRESIITTDREFLDGSQKCCHSISIIDCQPPDYYSAIEHSYPVSLSQMKLGEEMKKLDDINYDSKKFSTPQSSSSSSNETASNFIELDTVNLSNYENPPSYEEYSNNIDFLPYNNNDNAKL